MTLSLPRRTLLGGLLPAATLPWDMALAQSPPGGVLRVGMTAGAVPLSNGVPDQGAEGHRFMGITLYDHLVTWDLSRSDAPATLRPGLATAWRPDPAEPRRWIFTLRPGVRFRDGKAFTAEDVVFSFNRGMKPDHPAYDPRAGAWTRSRLATVVNWHAPAPDTFVLETSRPDSLIPYVCAWLGITHQGAWEAAGHNWDQFMLRAVGSGPWKLEQFVHRERCVMVRNADYWDPARVPKTERLVLLPLPEPNTRVAALRAGQVDFIEAPPPDTIPALRAAGMRIVANQYPHNWMWFFARTEGSPWNDPRIRRAANLAVDRAGMKSMLGGMMSEGAGIVPAGHPWYGAPQHPPHFDPAAARRVLAEAGFSPRTPLRTKVAISPSGSGQMQPLPMNEAVQQNLREVGIDVAFEVVEWNALLTLMREGAKAPGSVNRGIHAINVSWAPIDPYSGFIRVFKGDFAAPVAFNWGHLAEPAYDALMDRLLAEFDAEKQEDLLRELHARMVDEDAALFIAHDMNPRAMSPRVQGFVQARSWFQDLTPIRMS